MHRMIRNMVTRLTHPNQVRGQEQRLAAHSKPFVRRAGSALIGATLGLAAAMLTSGLTPNTAHGQGLPGQSVSLANYDMAASGFVTPAGMAPVSPAAMSMRGTGGSPVMPVGFNSGGCDTGGCDAMGMGMGMQPCMDRMVCGTCGGGGGCNCNSVLGGGILGKLKSNGSGCLFCRGAGCTACKELPFGYAGACCANLLELLAPCSDASLCNQRWYDFSIEGMSLRRDIGSISPSTVTNLGISATPGVSDSPVLGIYSIGDDDYETGVRVSAAMIWGVGGNIETTYMGGQEWGGSASVSSSTGNLYSYISDYGNFPAGAGGFDDTDRSDVQSLYSTSAFHSGELNYRRRTMFPYCRFQSSWLLGLRFIRYDDRLAYATQNAANAGFFNSEIDSKNKLFGPQAGFDFWWNVCPGLSLGMGGKAAWMQNDTDRRALITGNSFNPISAGDGEQKGALMGDFEFKMVYRFTHSFALRTSYYALGVDNVAFGGLSTQTPGSLVLDPQLQAISYDKLVLQGFTCGLEYMW